MLKNYRFEKIKNLIDTKEYISRFIKLKKVGQIYKGVCPFHNEKTPSFTVYPSGKSREDINVEESASFYCFGCGAAGDLFEFRKRWDHLNNKWESLELFEKELGIEIVDDEEMAQNHLKDQIEKMKGSSEQILSLSELNLICSSMCRNYLLWVREYVPNNYEVEKNIVDKYYLYFDRFFSEKSAIEAQKIVKETELKLKKRREDCMFVNM